MNYIETSLLAVVLLSALLGAEAAVAVWLHSTANKADKDNIDIDS